MLAVVCVNRRDGIVAGKARVAEPRGQSIAPRFSHGAVQSIDRYKRKAVDADQLGHSLDIEASRQQLLALRRGDPIEARVRSRRARYSHMDGARSRPSDHLDDLDRGRASNNRIVDENHAPAAETGSARIVLQSHPEMPDLIGRLNKGAADVMVSYNPEFERQTGFLRIADRRRDARVRNGNDNVRVDMALAGEFDADPLACFVDACPFDYAVGTC